MPSVIEIPRIANLEDIAGYDAFVRDLQSAYNLHRIDPTKLRWVEASPDPVFSESPPRVVVNPQTDTPQLAVDLHPRKDGKKVTGHATYHAPLLFREVERWGSSELRNHRVTQWRGREERDTFFKKKDSYPLNEFLDGLVTGLEDTTPVVEVVALLPISPDGSYDMEFVPHLRFDPQDHKHYKVMVVMEGAASAFSTLTNGQSRELQDINKDKNKYNWKAEFIADMSDMERLMLPSSAGHMVVIAKPVEEESPIYFNYGKRDGGDLGFKGGSDLFLGGGGMTRGGASIGGVSISQGSHVGKGSLFDGELRESQKGNAVIYHIRFLGVKPDVAQGLNKEGVDLLDRTLDSYMKE